VNTVSPGVIHTDGVEAVLREEAARRGWGEDWKDIQRHWFRDVLNDRTVDRLGTPEEVAALVAFVASPRAAYVNGANLRADGGKSPWLWCITAQELLMSSGLTDQPTRCARGSPSSAIRFSTRTTILASARWPSRLRDRRPPPSTRFRREKVHSAALRFPYPVARAHATRPSRATTNACRPRPVSGSSLDAARTSDALGRNTPSALGRA